MLVSSGPIARPVQRRTRVAIMDRHDVRIPDAFAVDEVVGGNAARPEHGQRGTSAAETRPTLRNPVGNFGIGMQPDKRRRTLSLLRVWSASPGVAPSGGRARSDLAILDLHEPDDWLIRRAAQFAAAEENGRGGRLWLLRSAGLRSARNAAPQAF